jgi:hypothetical protein
MSGINYKSQINMTVEPKEDLHVARLREATPALMTKAEFEALKVGETVPSLKRRQVVLTDVDTELTPYELGRPDWTNMETTNLITSTSGGSFTVQRTGYIYGRIFYRGDSTARWVKVNDRFVLHSDVTANASFSWLTETFPVTAGDIISYSSIDLLDATYGELYFIPPRLVSIAQPTVSEDFLNVAMIPDAAHIETVNRISANYGTWTADRTGFVKVGLTALIVATGDYYDVTVSVNNTSVWTTIERAGGAGSNWRWVKVISVAAGDTIKIESSSNTAVSNREHMCYFIPPKFVTTQAPNIIIGGPSYSTVEQATGEHWIDGKPIYRKQFTQIVSIPGPNPFTNIQFYIGASGDRLIRFEGLKFIPAIGMGYANWELLMPVAYGGESISPMIHNTDKRIAYISGKWGGSIDDPGINYNCTITGVAYYTKG